MAAPAYDVITMGRIGADIYPQSDGPLRGRDRVLAIPRRDGDERGRRRLPARPKHRRHHEGRRRPVRPLRGHGAPGVRRRHPLRRPHRRPADAGRLRRARPARGAADLVLPLSEGARHDARAGDDLDADAIRAAAIFWATGHRALRRAEPHDDDGRARDARSGRDDGPRPRLAAGALAATRRQRADRYRRALARMRPSSSATAPRCAVAVGELEPEAAAAALLALGAAPGDREARRRGRAGRDARRGARSCRRSGCEVVNGLGAGDAFGGALCHRLLAGDSPARRRAVRQRRRSARRRAGSPAPTRCRPRPRCSSSWRRAHAG